jgi:hypothetical protein
MNEPTKKNVSGTMSMSMPLLHYEKKQPPKKCDAMVGAKRGAPTHQCLNDAKWYPVLILRVENVSKVVRAGLEVHLCDSCKASCKLTDILSEGGWQTILQAFCAQGRKAPKHSLTQLGWTEIGSEEAHELLHSFS